MNIEGTTIERRAYPKQAVCRRIFIIVQSVPMTYDDPIIPIVLVTLDVIIGRANLGTILDRRKSFLRQEDSLLFSITFGALPSYVHHIL